VDPVTVVTDTESVVSDPEVAFKMLQSWRTSKAVQAESSKVVTWAPVTSPRWSFHSWSKLTLVDQVPS
jgi:hypothetical protein